VWVGTGGGGRGEKCAGEKKLVGVQEPSLWLHGFESFGGKWQRPGPKSGGGANGGWRFGKGSLEKNGGEREGELGGVGGPYKSDCAGLGPRVNNPLEKRGRSDRKVRRQMNCTERVSQSAVV